MGSTGEEDEESVRLQGEFWGALDQRLHNMVSAAVSAVDQTRPLIDYYAHEAEFVAEWEKRNRVVRDSPRAQFLRRLRNYLLHYGVAPVMQTMHSISVPIPAKNWDHLEIKLSADVLLRWKDWTTGARAFLEGFEGDGPQLSQVTQEYADDMMSLYGWLFSQYEVLHVPGIPPAHLSS